MSTEREEMLAIADSLIGIQEDIDSEVDRSAIGIAAHHLRRLAAAPPARSPELSMLLRLADHIVAHGRSITYPSIGAAQEVRNVVRQLAEALVALAPPAAVRDDIVWLREIDADTDNACWVISNRVDPDAVPFFAGSAYQGAPPAAGGVALREAFRNVDDEDWGYLISNLPTVKISGRFWRAVIKDVRAALAAPSETGTDKVMVPREIIDRFVKHYDLNDSDECMPSDALEIPIYDLRDLIGAARPAPSETGREVVGWRWRARGHVNWVYDPTEEWRLEHQGDDIEFQPLYTAQPETVREAVHADGVAQRTERSEPDEGRKDAGSTPVAVAPQPETASKAVAWNCIYPNYGRFTLREDEADNARAAGARVIPLYDRPETASNVREALYTEDELALMFFEYSACKEDRCRWTQRGHCDCRADAQRTVDMLKHVLPRSLPLKTAPAESPDDQGEDWGEHDGDLWT